MCTSCGTHEMLNKYGMSRRGTERKVSEEGPCWGRVLCESLEELGRHDLANLFRLILADFEDFEFREMQ